MAAQASFSQQMVSDGDYRVGVTYRIRWSKTPKVPGERPLQSSDGTVTVKEYTVLYDDSRYDARKHAGSCGELGQIIQSHKTPDCKDCLGYPRVGYVEIRRSGGSPDASARRWYTFRSAERGMNADSLLQKVKAACTSQEQQHKNLLEIAAREQRELEERADRERREREERAERDRSERRARFTVELAEGIKQVMAASSKPDSFSEFVIGSPIGPYRQVSYALPFAENCRLYDRTRISNSYPNAKTYACLFSTGDFSFEDYAALVASVTGTQGAIVSQVKLKQYRVKTDKSVVYVTQVPGYTSIAIATANYGAPDTMVKVAYCEVYSDSQIPGGCDTDGTAVAFAIAPPNLTIPEIIATVRGSTHGAMPPFQPTDRSGSGGMVSIEVSNTTPYQLFLYFDGPTTQRFQFGLGETRTIVLAPGPYSVAGKVSSPTVTPFYGTESYDGSFRYSVKFYIRTSRY